MSAAPSKRVVAEVRFGEDRSSIMKAGGRSIHQYWTLLSPHFRDVFLAPQRRSDDGGVSWTWREPGENAAPTAAELAGVRSRLERAKESFEENPVNPLLSEGRGGAASTQEVIDQVAARVKAMADGFCAKPDGALAEFVCRTETGVMIHSWGLAAPAKISYPDSQESGVGGVVLVGGKGSPGNDVVIENAKGLRVARTSSDEAGEFSFLKIAPGRYRVRVVSGPGEFSPKGETVEVERGEVKRIELRSTKDPEPAAGETTGSSDSAADGQSSNPRARRRGIWIILGVVAVVVVVGGVIWFVSSRSNRNRSSSAQRISTLTPENYASARPASETPVRQGSVSGERLGAAVNGPGGPIETTVTRNDGLASAPLPLNGSSGKATEPRIAARVELTGPSQQSLPAVSGSKTAIGNPEGLLPSSAHTLDPTASADVTTDHETTGVEDSTLSADRLSANVDARGPSAASPANFPEGATLPGAESQKFGKSADSPAGDDVPKLNGIKGEKAGSLLKKSGGAVPNSPGGKNQLTSPTPSAEAGAAAPDLNGSPSDAASESGGENVPAESVSIVEQGHSSAPDTNQRLDTKDSSDSDSGKSAKTRKQTSDSGKPSRSSKVNVARQASSTSSGGAAASSQPNGAAFGSTAGDASGVSTNSASEASASDRESRDTFSTNAAVNDSAQSAAADKQANAAKLTGKSEQSGRSKNTANAREQRRRGASAEKPVTPGSAAKTDNDRSSSSDASDDLSPPEKQPAADLKPWPVSLRNLGIVQVGEWVARLRRDAIVPTLPVKEGAGDSTEALRSQVLREERAHISVMLRRPTLQYGFNFKLTVAAKAQQISWQGAQQAMVSLSVGENAEIGWPGVVSPANCAFSLVAADGSELARVEFDGEGRARVGAKTDVRASFWIGALYSRTEDVRSNGMPRYVWQVLGGALGSSPWFNNSAWCNGAGCRLDVVLNGAPPAGTRLALMDQLSGWQLTTELK
ncbi:MAG: hypothetical protein QM790_11640 [Nibricoccus sp.]